MDLSLGGPAVPKQRDREEPRSYKQRGKTVLRKPFTAVGVSQTLIYFVCDQCGAKSKQRSDAEAQIIQPHDANVLVIHGFEENWECSENEVDVSLNISKTATSCVP